MQSEMAIEKLNELRSVVDGDVAEMVDTLATVILLKQDMSNPMYGAKVTYYDMPDGEWVEIDEEEYNNSDKEEKPWMWRKVKFDGSNLKDSFLEKKNKNEDDVWYEYKKYQAYSEKEAVHRDEVPDPLDPNQPLEDDIKLAREELDGEWMIYEKDFREYRVKRFVEPNLQKRNAIVYDPMLSELPSDMQLWDPNRGEYTTPEDYPMGTVNLIVAEKGEFGEDYSYKVKSETSVSPCEGEPSPHTYTPGWR